MLSEEIARYARIMRECHLVADESTLVNWADRAAALEAALYVRAAQFLTADEAEIVFTGGKW